MFGGKGRRPSWHWLDFTGTCRDGEKPRTDGGDAPSSRLAFAFASAPGAALLDVAQLCCACLPDAHSTSNLSMNSSVIAAHLSRFWAVPFHASPPTLATFRSSSSWLLYWCGCLALTLSGESCSARHHCSFVGPGCLATRPSNCQRTRRMKELHLPPQAVLRRTTTRASRRDRWFHAAQSSFGLRLRPMISRT